MKIIKLNINIFRNSNLKTINNNLKTNLKTNTFR